MYLQMYECTDRCIDRQMYRHPNVLIDVQTHFGQTKRYTSPPNTCPKAKKPMSTPNNM